jgi:hypothetical protein
MRLYRGKPSQRVTHGTRGCYEYGCRCPLCKAAVAKRERAKYAKRKERLTNSTKD